MISPFEHVPLADRTTIGLGGTARYFLSCNTPEDVSAGLRFAHERQLPVQVLGGGSNIVFPDEEYPGLVLHVGIRGIAITDDGDSMLATVAAGEPWDAFVEHCVNDGLGGIECLSGIPGLVGATPIQNVGAYGQEVSETVVDVKALDRSSGNVVTIPAAECGFGYRQSRFKGDDADRYIILEVRFRLRKSAVPVIRYPELQKHIGAGSNLESLQPGRPSLRAVREGVIALRRKKSMVVDPADPNSRSVGSFFMNPVLSQEAFENLKSRWSGKQPVPSFPASAGVKVPAAWLVERAGFPRGFTKGGVGVSEHHALALINRGGTTRELLDLAAAVQRRVYERFGVRLEREPVVVTSNNHKSQ